ncbi:hypothetical protein ACSS6W_009720 [Trichoderma asperelloides]|nr:Cloroperoxidase [Trichoderma asperelloides]
MMLFFATISFAALVTALPASVQIQPWIPAGMYDSRGPCPMLNTLANHGYLPHNGRNLTDAMIENAFTKFLNVEAGFAAAVKEFTHAFGNNVFNLDDLNAPDILQHIASLTRDDYTSHDPHIRPNLYRIESLFDDSPSAHIDIDSIAKSRLRVQAESHPHTLSKARFDAALFEAAMVLVMMLDHAPDATSNPPLSAYRAPKDRLRTWFEQERFPIELGWQPSKRPIMLADLDPAIKAITESMERQEKERSKSRIALKVDVE